MVCTPAKYYVQNARSNRRLSSDTALPHVVLWAESSDALTWCCGQEAASVVSFNQTPVQCSYRIMLHCMEVKLDGGFDVPMVCLTQSAFAPDAEDWESG